MTTLARLPSALATLVLLGGCDAMHSDSENFARRERAEHARRVAGMRAATRQAPAGERAAGDALVRLVSGKTHAFVYGVTPLGRPGRYVEDSYFRPDGRFVYTNSEWARDPAGRDGDRWRIEGERLCIVNGDLSPDERCYTLAVLPDGRVQYFIDAPGDETDGLLTKVTDEVRGGPP